MAILLPDIRSAVQTYLNTNVTVTISAITPDVPAALSPGEEGTFSVTVVNAALNGVRLLNVRYHLVSTNPAQLKLKVPAAGIAIARSGVLASSAALAAGTLVNEMFLFPPVADNSLDVGDTDSIAGLKVKAIALGNPTLTCHIHADPDLDYLFPKDENNPNGTKVVSIV